MAVGVGEAFCGVEVVDCDDPWVQIQREFEGPHGAQEAHVVNPPIRGLFPSLEGA